MGLVLTSNRTFTGASTQPALSGLTTNYAKYKARVEADGATVQNEATCSAAFDFLAAQGIPPHLAFAVGSQFGVKKSGKDVQKLYSFDGNDFILLGVGTKYPQYDNTTYAFPVIDLTTPVPLNFRTQQTTRIQAGDAYCFAQAVRDNASDGRIGGFWAFYPNGANQPPAGIEPYNGDFGITAVYGVAPRPGYTTGANQAVLTACIRSTLTPYSAWGGIAMHARQSTGVMKMYKDNVLQETITDVSNTLFDMRNQAVYLGHGAAQASGSSFAYYSYEIAEVWQIKDCSEANAQALSNRLHTLYF